MRNAEFLVVDLIAAWGVALGLQNIQTEGRVVVELPVAIGLAAQIAVGSIAQVAFGEVTQLGALARQINAAASRAPPAICRVGPLDAFPPFPLAGCPFLASPPP